MIKIGYKAWDEVSISLYKKIKSICEREDLEPLDKNIKLIALLSDTPEDEVWDLKMEATTPLFQDISWLWEFDFSKKWKGKKLKLHDRVYKVCVDLQNFTMAQYVDFQTLFPKMKESDENYSAILSTILIPDGKDYNRGYDILEEREFLEENLPITTANTIFYFFLTSLRDSLRAISVVYSVMMKLQKMRTRSREKKEKITQLEEKVKILIAQAENIICSL